MRGETAATQSAATTSGEREARGMCEKKPAKEQRCTAKRSEAGVGMRPEEIHKQKGAASTSKGKSEWEKKRIWIPECKMQPTTMTCVGCDGTFPVSTDDTDMMKHNKNRPNCYQHCINECAAYKLLKRDERRMHCKHRFLNYEQMVMHDGRICFELAKDNEHMKSK